MASTNIRACNNGKIKYKPCTKKTQKVKIPNWGASNVCESKNDDYCVYDSNAPIPGIPGSHGWHDDGNYIMSCQYKDANKIPNLTDEKTCCTQAINKKQSTCQYGYCGGTGQSDSNLCDVHVENYCNANPKDNKCKCYTKYNTLKSVVNSNKDIDKTFANPRLVSECNEDNQLMTKHMYDLNIASGSICVINADQIIANKSSIAQKCGKGPLTKDTPSTPTPSTGDDKPSTDKTKKSNNKKKIIVISLSSILVILFLMLLISLSSNDTKSNIKSKYLQ